MIIGKDGYIGSDLELETEDIILLAGHSSVKMAQNDPDGAWINNVEFFRSTLSQAEKLIYASSATVYDGLTNPTEDNNAFNLSNVYNLTKHTIDQLALLSGKKVYGLRFATVCGWSSNLRVDVMLNKMVYDAINTGKVLVKNRHIERPILGIKDCHRAIKHFVENDLEPGIYNLASFTASIDDMAKYVAQEFNAEVVYDEYDNIPAYAYGINCDKVKFTSFRFEETLESVVDSLKQPFKKVGVRE
jgi:nucleoside-diphosphate-sugar epimerase